MRKGAVAAFHGLHARALYLGGIDHKQDFAEVVAARGARVVLARRDRVALGERLGAQRLVDGGARRPGAAPVLPALAARGHLLEVDERHAVRDEARRPVGDCGFDSRVFHGCLILKLDYRGLAATPRAVAGHFVLPAADLWAVSEGMRCR